MIKQDRGTQNFLDQPRAGRMTVQYGPTRDNSLTENPPRFSWLPVVDEEAQYALRVSQDNTFTDSSTLSFENLPLNFYTPDSPLPPGQYFWCYAEWSSQTNKVNSEWSEIREFELTDDLPSTPLPSRTNRYQHLDNSHPRLWLQTESLQNFQAALTNDPEYLNWPGFFEKSVQPWIDRDIMAEPKPYPNNTRTPPVWRQTYIDCQELLYAIRHMAIAGHVVKDQAMLDQAKAWLLSASEWDPDGTTSRSYTDEWAYRVALALAWGYDWLHDELSPSEQKMVRRALLARTRQVADHAIANAKIQLFPYDSHAVRSVSAVLVPACIAMLHEEPEAREWLDYSIEFLMNLYSPWGDSDGGWAEGPHYWMTGIAYLIDAANLLKSYVGIDLYLRPFLQRTGDFPLHTKSPHTRRCTFGDDSTLGDLPCLKVGYNMRQLAGVTGNGHYQWYFDELLKNDPGTEMEFYNYGWWDLNFDDMVYRHDFPSIEAVPPQSMGALKWFKGIGWVALHERPDDPAKHIQLILKSSPFGSISHSHGDQNAFVMSAFGEDLAIQSGYYVAFNSSMHQSWRRQTRSKNALLINGQGQYADQDKQLAMRSTGKIICAEQHDDHCYIHADATAAYATLNPQIQRVSREIYFIRQHYFVIVDSIDASDAVTIDWLLHTPSPMEVSQKSFRFQGTKAGFYGQFIWSEAGNARLSQIEGFPDVDPGEYEGLPVSSHLQAHFPASKHHRIAALLVPYPIDEPRRIFNFVDDQGYDSDLYFTDADEQTFKVKVKKLADSGTT